VVEGSGECGGRIVSMFGCQPFDSFDQIEKLTLTACYPIWAPAADLW
jgi:hypothetical protein